MRLTTGGGPSSVAEGVEGLECFTRFGEPFGGSVVALRFAVVGRRLA